MPHAIRLWAAALAAALLLAACGSGEHRTTSGQTHGRSARHSSDPLAGLKLWVNPDSPAVAQEVAWRQVGKTADAADIARIAMKPTAVWLTGGAASVSKAKATVDNAQHTHTVAQLVVYDIPHRDCGGDSSGGALTADAYVSWIRKIARTLGADQVIVILEPDAIDQAAAGCLSSVDTTQRYVMLATASKLLRRDPHAHVYLDAGDAGWLRPQKILKPLELSGIADDAGFSLNVSNFFSTDRSLAYGRQLSALLNGKHFVVDTSRSGNGAPKSKRGVSRWCNPAGRALGHSPTTDTGERLVDALLWVKYPGQSDGTCGRGEPVAGQWWPAYALGLLSNTRQ